MFFIRKIALLLFIFIVPLDLSAREFLNTFLHINFGVTYGQPYGNIINEEEDSFEITGSATGSKPEHNDVAFGIIMDIAPFPPIILGDDAHAVKFGVRGGYRFHYLQQTVEVTSSTTDEKETFAGDLLKFRSWMIGPVIHYAPVITASGLSGEYTATGGFTFYVLYGQLQEGVLTKFPGMREYGESVSNYETTVTGYKIDIGIGAEISVCSVNLGLNIYFTMINLNLDEEVYDSLGSNGSISAVCFEVYMGIPVD